MSDDVNWLNEEEAKAWLNLWSIRVWLSSRLDAHFKQDVGISHYDYFALAQISQAPSRQLRMSDLAAVADMTLSHLSRVVTRLEKAGWVERIPDPDDGRSTLAALTPEGWDLVQRVAPGHVAQVRHLIFDHLTPEETRVLGSITDKIVKALNPPWMPRA